MAGQTTSSKALIYLSERVEDAAEAVKGLIGGSGSAKYLDTADDKITVIRSQLESDRDDLRIEGLRTIIALISKGRDASSYFPHVLKLTSNSNLEIRKLVYIIVRRYAKRQPDVALLGINSFQRDLLDRSEVVRAMALRVLSGLRLPLVASVVELAIAKCVKDPHFYVRKVAALAIVKCYRLSPETRPALKVHLATLLSDRHPVVLSAAITTYSATWPLEWSMLHANFRKLCHALSDMDEWGQRNAVETLGLYAKRCIRRPIEGTPLDSDLQLLFAKVEDLLMSRNPSVITASIRLLYTLGPPTLHSSLARPLVRLTQQSTPDIAYFALINCLLLSQASPSLFQEQISAFTIRSSQDEPAHISIIKLKVLVQLASLSSSEMVLAELCEQARFHPDDDVAQAAVDQIGALAKRSTEATHACIRHLLSLTKDCNDRDTMVGRAVSVIRELLPMCPREIRAMVVSRLSALLFSAPPKPGVTKRYKLLGKSTVKSELARASIFWLLGQHCQLDVNINRKGLKDHSEGRKATLGEAIGGDVLRRAASNFVNESALAKLQIVTLSTKLYTFLPNTAYAQCATIKLLHTYILQLARYDTNFDVRDRGRFCKALTDRLEVTNNKAMDERKGGEARKDGQKMGEETADQQLGGVILRREQVMHILFEGKPGATIAKEELPFRTDLGSKPAEVDMDSISYVFGGQRIRREATHDIYLAPWAAEADLPSPSVREPELIAPTKLISIETQKSFSSDSPSGAASRTQSANGSPLLRETPLSGTVATTTSSKQPSSRYKDLDAFLDEESEEDVAEEEEEEEEDENESEDEEEEENEEDEESTEEDLEVGASEERSESDSSQDEESGPLTRLIAGPIEDNEWAK